MDDAKLVGMGWTSPEVSQTSFDGLWQALVFSARNVDKFLPVSDVTVVDRPGFLCRTMTIKATNERVEEHVYADERKGEMRYRKVDSKTKRETDDERVIAVKESPLRLEFFHRHASDGYRIFWQAPTEHIEQMVNAIIVQAGKMEKSANKNVGLDVKSQVITGVSHDAMWRAMVESRREPGRFFACSGVSVRD